MIRTFSRALSSDSLFKMQGRQYSEKLLLSLTVPAGTTANGATNVSNLGHFLCLSMTGRFETLRYAGTPPAIVDDGVCHLRGMLYDTAGNRRLFSDFIPLDLLFSPGRRLSNTAVNVLLAVAGVADRAYEGYPLFYPSEFEYLFPANSTIGFDVKNDSDVDQSCDIVFHGIRILTSASVSGLRPMHSRG